ncbi:MAG: prephenate dehydrogenase/arogenate dehydrogenase family protein [Endomicrobium sp.]|jgi:prephenate dehydrogenase|nr:prephenate dehydrogenase/arogenate dehydrogenase family protein [Endomicrobium sp.]
MYKVSIIGMGQMGGSLGKALKTFGKKYDVTGIDKDKKTLKAALKLGAADRVSQSLNAAKDSEIIVICLPVDSISPVYEQLLKIAGKETVITDAGSVKENIVLSKDKRNFVPAHPMAGREKNGIMSADAQMFKNANLIIAENENPSAQKKVMQIWKDAGAKIVKMSAKKHDNLAALTSHLPHIIAFSLNKIYKESKRKNPEIDTLTAGSFKSMTRVSVSSADMWAPIFAMNAANVRKHLNDFIKELESFKKALGSQNKLKKEILKTQKK